MANNLLEFFLFKKFCLITQCEKSGVNRILWFFCHISSLKNGVGNRATPRNGRLCPPRRVRPAGRQQPGGLPSGVILLSSRAQRRAVQSVSAAISNMMALSPDGLRVGLRPC